jgi:predicted amidohydrolase YtcJ
MLKRLPGSLPALVVAVPLLAQPTGTPQRLAVRAARLIDPDKAEVVANAVVLVEGERVTAVGSGLPVPAGVRVVDLGAMTLLPGLIDVHTHLTHQSADYYSDKFRRSPIDAAVVAHVYARRTSSPASPACATWAPASWWMSRSSGRSSAARSLGRACRSPPWRSRPPAATAT